ncbi:MAG TPA: aminoglycoside phosphotransferase family protein [Dehalococcoidia bacterium]|nr:aminoglycoside phosphotransferase family protein [Dehalococcoidia bacterium]
MNARDARRILSACLPDLPLRGVRRLGAGWDSDAFRVENGEATPLVFRFPRRAPVAEALERALRLLPELGPTLPAPVPRFTYVVRGCAAAPFPFAGYPLLPGRTLLGTRLSAAKLRRLSADLGGFLAALHRFPAARAEALGIPPASVAGGRDQLAAFLARATERVAPLLGERDRERFGRWIASLDRLEQFAFTPVLLHGDLYDDQILVDPAAGRLTGVIDFDDAARGDPALDFAGLLRNLGEPFARETVLAYGADAAAVESIVRRAAVYVAIAPLHEILYGLEIGDERHTKEGLRELRDTLASCNS